MKLNADPDVQIIVAITVAMIVVQFVLIVVAKFVKINVVIIAQQLVD